MFGRDDLYMQGDDLKKMNRKELLQLLYEQGQKLDEQQQQIDAMKAQLTGERLSLSNAGSIADAAMEVFNVFETAQKAADAYLDSVKTGFREASGGSRDMTGLRNNVRLARTYTDKVKRSMLLECRILSEFEDVLIALEESMN